MSGWLAGIGPWHWLLLGVLLIISELLSPAAVFIWLAVAAGLVGLILVAFPQIDWLLQLLLFAGLSLLSLVVGRRFFKHHPIATDRPNLNRRGHQYVGRVFTLDAPIVNGGGRIKVDDTTWKISGADCPEGTRITVTGVDGVILTVRCKDGDP